MISGKLQPFKLIVGEQSFNLSLSSEISNPERHPNGIHELIKLSGPIPWVGEPTEYFPEEIIGLTLKDSEENEYYIAEAEYDLKPCGQRVVKHLWLKRKESTNQ